MSSTSNEEGLAHKHQLSSVTIPYKTSYVNKNKTILPFICELIHNEIEGLDRVILDAPTLFEAGLEKECDYVVGVIADKDLRLQWICQRDGLDRENAQNRIFEKKRWETHALLDFIVDLRLNDWYSMRIKEIVGG